MLFIQLLIRLSASAQQHTLETRAAGLSPFARCRYIFWISRLYAFLFPSNMTLQICSQYAATLYRALAIDGPHKEICTPIERVKMFPHAAKWISRTEASEGEAELWFNVRTVNNEEQWQDPHCLLFRVLFSLFVSLPAEMLSTWASHFLTFPSLAAPLPHLSAPHTLVTLVQFLQKPASKKKKNPMALEENIILINSKCDLAIKVTFTLLNTPH